MLQEEIKNKLVSSMTTENLRRRPVQVPENLFAKEKTSTLVAMNEDLEAHSKETHTDIHHQDQTVLTPDMPPPPSPHYQFNISPPNWRDVIKTGKSCIFPWT